jgi:hypothetical protein
MTQSIEQTTVNKSAEKPVTYYGGIEGNLSGWGKFILGTCIILGIVCFVVSGSTGRGYSADKWSVSVFSGFWISVGIGTIIQGIVLYLFLSALAEIIRLLKKSNGLPYSGQISIVYKEPLFDGHSSGTDANQPSMTPLSAAKKSDQ